jgi:propionyl-CoA carboxylase beta chain
VPRVQIITRKGYGGAFVVMNSKSIGADLAFAWPGAEIAVMDANGAANIIFRREIDAAEDPIAKKAELVEQYSERFANPYNAGERGYVDDVIDPRDTRRVLVESLEMLRSKKEKLPQRKHGNVPL